ncbi:unnamed protein product, partial [Ixodes hexagonus]
KNEARKRSVVACYLQKAALERTGMNGFSIAAIPAEMCTHVVYSHLKIDQRSGRLVFKSFEYSTDMSSLRKLYCLKSSKPGFKLIVAYGHGRNRAELLRVIGSKSKREEFIKSTVLLILRFGFDGLNLHWEGPGPSICKPHLNRLYRFLKASSPDLKCILVDFLTFFIMLPACQLTCPNDLDMWRLALYVDYLHLIAYDYHSNDVKRTTSYSALFSKEGDITREDTESCTGEWVDAGVPRDQLVIGISALGRNYKVPFNGSYGINAPTAPDDPLGNPGFLSHTKGYLNYIEICRNTKYWNWNREWDNGASTPYAYNNEEWVSYDDTDSVWLKTQWFKHHGLAGVFLWSLDNDDYNGHCGESYPLLRKAYEVLKDYKPPFEGECPMPHYGVNLKCSNSSQPSPDYTDCRK